MAQRIKNNPFEEARSLLGRVTAGAKTGVKNLQAWGQVTSSPQLRQDYNKLVIQPSRINQNVIQPVSNIYKTIQSSPFPTVVSNTINRMPDVGTTQFGIGNYSPVNASKPVLNLVSSFLLGTEQQRNQKLQERQTLRPILNKINFRERGWGLNPQEADTFARISATRGTELALNASMGLNVKPGAFSQAAVNIARNFGPETRSAIGRFSELVEKGKGKNIMGNLGDYVHSVAEGVFGRSAANMSNKQLKNAFDILLEQVDNAGGALPRPQIGFSVQDLRAGKKTTTGVSARPLGASAVPVQPSGQISPQLAGLETKPQKLLQPKPKTQTGAGGGSGTGSNVPPSEPIISQDIEKAFRDALNSAGLKRETQEAIYKVQRGRRFARFEEVGARTSGEAGAYQQLSQLGGPMKKIEFDTLRKNLNQESVDALFDKGKGLTTAGEQATYINGLRKMLGGEGGIVPTRSELEVMSQVLSPETIQAILDKRPMLQKLFSGIEGGLNLPRAVMATADLSAPLRQGIFMVGRPKQFIPAVKEMFKYALDEKAYTGWLDGVKVDPYYKLAKDAGISFTDMSPLSASREEAFMSRIAERLPLVKRSGRAYTGFLNKLRFDVFRDIVKTAEKQGIRVDGKRLTDLGSFINSATGRGNLSKALEKAAPILNATFFSPRLMASRLNLLNPLTYVRYDPFVRKEALKTLLSSSAILGTILGISKIGGAEVGTDPRSADFGKIKVGNTRYDILGGFQQYMRFATQFATGQIVSSTTGKIITAGEGYKPLTRKDIVMRFFENKESPVASFVTAWLTGKNSLGENFRPSVEVIDRFIPLVLQDMYDLTKEYGPIGILAGVPGVFGVGSQTYGKQELVMGKNQLGQPSSQLKASGTLSEDITNTLFGRPLVGSTPQYAADAYFKQLQKFSKEEANAKYREILKINPDLAKKIKQAKEDYEKGITPANETLKTKGVKNGDRAITIKKELDKLSTKEEKNALVKEYRSKGIITDEVFKQLKILVKGGL